MIETKVIFANRQKNDLGEQKFYTGYFIWQVVYGLPAIFGIISFRLICKNFLLPENHIQND